MAVGMLHDFLRGKITPPELPTRFLSRERLMELLTFNKAKRLITIVGGPGYGKTFLALHFLSTLKAHKIWYSLDEFDADTSVFLGYLLEAISSAVPKDLAHLFRQLEARANDLSDPHSLIRSICARLSDHVPGETYMVLDDFQKVNENQCILDVVEELLLYMPSTCHLMIISQVAPGISMGRLRIHDDVYELGSDDLAFTTDEAKAFLVMRAPSLADDEIETLAEISGGWVAALIIASTVAENFRETMIGQGIPQVTIGAITRQRIYDVFREYLSRSLSEQMVNFLTDVSPLNFLSPSCCDYITGRTDSEKCLETLIRRNLFISRVTSAQGHKLPEPAYRPHPLLREYLLTQLHRDTERWIEVNLKAAQYFRSMGDHLSEIEYLINANEFETAATLLERLAPEMVRRGMYHRLSNWLDSMPDSVVNAHLALVVAVGNTLEARGEWDRALDMYTRARYLSGEGSGQSPVVASALWWTAGIQWRRGCVREAISFCEAALDLADPNDDGMKAGIYNLLGNCYYEIAEDRLGEANLKMALGLFQKTGEASGQGWVLNSMGFQRVQRGGFNEAIDYFERALLFFRRAGNRHGEIHVLSNLAESLRLAGNLNRAYSISEAALTAARQIEDIRSICAAMVVKSRILLDRGEIKSAMELVNGARSLSEHLADRFIDTGIRIASINLAVAIGDHDAAHVFAQPVLAEGPDRIDDLYTARVALALARAEALRGNTDAVEGLLEYVRPILENYHSRYDLTEVLLLTLLIMDPGDPCWPKTAEMFLRSCMVREYTSLAISYGEALKPVLIKAAELGIFKDYVQRLLQQIGSCDSKVASADQPATQESGLGQVQTPAAIEINLLGTFIVKRRGAIVGDVEWKTQKARLLLKYLAFRRGQWIPIETLIELFWPHLDPDAARHNLQVTLHVVRRVLEPGLPARKPSRYISFRNAAYRLESCPDIKIDAEEFIELWERMKVCLASGDLRGAEEAALKGVNLYRGDYLEEDLYEDWTAGPRERVMGIYLGMLHELAHICKNSGRHEEAISWCRKVLSKNLVDEEAYRVMIQCYAASGGKGQAIKAYKRCHEILRKELGVPPSNKTKLALKEALGLF